MFTQDLADRFRAHETLGEAHSANSHLCAPELFNSGTLKDISDSDRDVHSPLEVFTKILKAYLNFHPSQSSSVSLSDWRNFLRTRWLLLLRAWSWHLSPSYRCPIRCAKRLWPNQHIFRQLSFLEKSHIISSMKEDTMTLRLLRILISFQVETSIHLYWKSKSPLNPHIQQYGKQVSLHSCADLIQSGH